MLLASFFTSLAGAEPLDSAALAKKKICFSIAEAAAEPNEAYRLCLGGQDLEGLDESIGGLEKMQEINLSQNFLTEIPESICDLHNLTELRLANNSIRKLPERFGELENLRYLDLSGNFDLDVEQALGIICALPNLEYLDLGYTGINKLPSNFWGCKSVKELNLSGNELSDAVKEKLKYDFPETVLLFDY